MPHAALYVVQQKLFFSGHDERRFQCRTQHYMWCNNLCQHDINVLPVSMPHAALYVVQQCFSRS